MKKRCCQLRHGIIWLRYFTLTFLILLGGNAHAQSGSDSLALYRSRIDSLDAALFHLLGERMRTTDDVGRYKARHGLPVLQPQRFAELKERAVRTGRQEGLREPFVRNYLELIHQESVDRQNTLSTHE